MGFSSGFALIIVEQSAQALAALNASFGWQRIEFWPVELVTLMVSFLMIVHHELSSGLMEAGLTDQDYAVSAGLLNNPHKGVQRKHSSSWTLPAVEPIR